MITLGFITARKKPNIDWFLQSLCRQSGFGVVRQIVIVDYFAQACDGWTEDDVAGRREMILKCAYDAGLYNMTQWVPPHPNVWGGKYRLPKDPWWHASTCRNTVFCYATQPFVTCTDDRCVLMPSWLDAVNESRINNYIVCGSYEKRTGMTVDNGVITHGGIVTGEDSRLKIAKGNRMKAPGSWMFGCTFGLPLEWALEVNGQEELMDGLSMEDVIFGCHLENNGRPLFYDPRMHIVEDRTPSELGEPMKRTSKERHPHDLQDKGHEAWRRFAKLKRTEHPLDLRKVREEVLSGKPFPIPTEPQKDWFDQQPIKDM